MRDTINSRSELGLGHQPKETGLGARCAAQRRSGDPPFRWSRATTLMGPFDAPTLWGDEAAYRRLGSSRLPAARGARGQAWEEQAPAKTERWWAAKAPAISRSYDLRVHRAEANLASLTPFHDACRALDSRFRELMSAAVDADIDVISIGLQDVTECVEIDPSV